MAFEVEAIELNEADARPSHLELKVSSADFNQATSQRLNRILKSYPGRDGVVLFVSQGDGRKFRAELPVTVDARSQIMLSEIQDLVGRPVWSRAAEREGCAPRRFITVWQAETGRASQGGRFRL